MALTPRPREKKLTRLQMLAIVKAIMAVVTEHVDAGGELLDVMTPTFKAFIAREAKRALYGDNRHD